MQDIGEPSTTYQLFNNRCDICTVKAEKRKCDTCANKQHFNIKRFLMMILFGLIALFVSLYGFKTSVLSSVGYFTAAVSVGGAFYNYFFG